MLVNRPTFGTSFLPAGGFEEAPGSSWSGHLRHGSALLLSSVGEMHQAASVMLVRTDEISGKDEASGFACQRVAGHERETLSFSRETNY